MQCNICENEMKLIASSSKYRYFRCPVCDWYGTEKIEGQKQEENFNYDNYKTFDDNLGNYENYVREAMRILRFKFNMINEIPRNFLDIGCSEGVFVEAYDRLTESKNGYGIEIALPKIERARNRKLNVYGFDDMPDIVFDFVFLRHVIEHIVNPIEYLRMVSKLVAPGGILWIETPNQECFDNAFKGNRIKDDRFVRDLYPPTHICGFCKKTLEHVAAELDMKLEKNLTHDVRNTNWYYMREKSNTFTDRIMINLTEKLNIASNVVCVLRKK